MKRVFVIVFILAAGISIYPINYEFSFPLEHKDIDGMDGVDFYVDITDPFDWFKAYAELAAGFASANLYSDLKINVIWNEDSVIQGESLLVKIIAQPVKGPNHTIYTNFGACAGVGTKTRLFGLLGGEWASGPGYGLDFNFNIECDDNPPFFPGENAKGDDVVDFLSLIPDLAGKSGGKVGALLDDKGDTLLLYPKDGSSGASDVMGLFDFLSLRLSAGFKTENGLVRVMTYTDNSVVKRFSQLESFDNRYDTLYMRVFIDSFAPQNSLGYLYLENPSYRVDLYRRIGLCLQAFGITIGSTYWVDEDFYEFIGIRDMELHSSVPDYDRVRAVPIKVIGEPLYRPDLMVRQFFQFAKDRWGNPVDFVQAGVATDIGIQYENVFDDISDTSVMEITIDNVHKFYTTIDSLSGGEGGWYMFNYTFPETGIHKIEAEINYNHAVEEIVYSNNKRSSIIEVVSPMKHVMIEIKDSLGMRITDDSVFTVNSNYGVSELYKGTDTLFHAYLPGNDTVLFTMIPDTGTDYAPTSFYLVTNSIPIDSYFISKEMYRFGSIEGSVTNQKGDPIPNANVTIGAYSTTTDSEGVYMFDRVIPLPDTFKFLAKVSHPAFQDYFEYIAFSSNDKLKIPFILSTADSIAPNGVRQYLDGYWYVSGKYRCVKTRSLLASFIGTDDFSGIYSVETRTPATSWTEYKVGEPGVDNAVTFALSLDEPAFNGWTSYFYRFKDLAGNISDSIKDSVIMVVDGPSGNFNLQNTVVYSPSANLLLSASDSMFHVRYVQLAVTGYPSLTQYLPFSASPVSITLPNETGVYEISATFVNSENCWGHSAIDTVTYNERGSLVLNNGVNVTNGLNVPVEVYPKTLSTSNSINNDKREGTSYSQTFIPNTDIIQATGILFTFVDSGGVFVGIYTDTFDGIWHTPKTCLGTAFVDTADYGWKYVMFEPAVAVNSSELHHLVLYSDYFNYYNLNGGVRVSTDDASYPSGTMLYNPSSMGWYNLNVDMAFKIYTSADSLWLSNYQDLSSHTTYTSSYPSSWNLLPGAGYKTVYGEFFSGGSGTGIISDGIIFDNEPPYECSISLNRNSLYTNEPNCTVFCYYKENISEMASVEINGVSYGNVQSGYTVTVNFDDTSTGTKTVTARFYDDMGNYSSPMTKYIDYDKNGISFTPLFNNSSSKYIQSRYPILNINTAKSVTPDSVRFSEDITDKGIYKPYNSSYSCTLLADRFAHTMFVELKDNYGHVTRSVLSAYVDSTKPEGMDYATDGGSMIPYTNTLSFSWGGNPSDPESGIEGVYGKLTNGSGSTVETFKINPLNTGIEKTASFSRYETYYLKLYSVNNAGISSDTVTTDGIVMNTPPVDLNLVYPYEGESVSNRPSFTLRASDGDPDTMLKYVVEIATDEMFSNIVRTFDMRISTDLWSKESYCSEEDAVLSIDEANELEVDSSYYWRARVYDPISSASSGARSFTCGFQGVEASYSLSMQDSLFKMKINSNMVKNRKVTVNLSIPRQSELNVRIIDAKGSVVKVLFDSMIGRGGFNFEWDLSDNKGAHVASGIYFIMAEYEGMREKIKINLVK
ncbi:MAG: FlgD immunoglobulin-like domain containing protein [bacterium]|nr:FlgD immunoglobulin-like domain containing protein [bacterium]